MGRKLKGGFKTRQQKERLKKVSAGLLERRNNVDLDPSVLQLHDHCYSSLDSEQNVPSNVKSWNSGRRIVELGVLAEGLSGSMVHTGIGGRQVNSFLTALNIPPVSNTLLSARQKESGSAIETVAETTIAECLSQEIDITKQKFDSNELTVSVDGAWQKRGSGRSYDSLSGHCSMIGTETGKVLGFSVRSKYCKMCDEATRKGVQAKTHDCRMNWDGSAKAMEQDMVVEMVQSIKSKGSNVGTIIADDDTTTIARLRKSVDPNIKKMSDKNHVKKNIANALYQLKAKHKKLTPKVIKYLINCLNYMLCQNQDNPKGVENGLEATDLTDLMKVYKKQSQKLSKLGSTQGNESFNKSVASKAPKSHFYSGTSSLNVRVAASVAQKNDGQCYLIKVCLILNSKLIFVKEKRSTTTSAYLQVFIQKRLAILRDLQARKRRAISITRKEKIRRIQLRNRRVKRNAVKEMCEGTSYSCQIDLQDHQDIVEIPSAPVPPEVHCNIPNTAKVICFDLETTSLARDSHITQIAAVNGESHWTSYVIPKLPISSQASEVTGLTMRNGRMFHQGKVVESSTISTALDGFLEFLKAAGHNIYLTGHNIKTFDCHILINTLKSVGKTEELKKCVEGFVDTRLLFKINNPDLKSFSQVNLIKTLMNCSYDAHDALEDVIYLQKLLDFTNIRIADPKFSTATFTVQTAYFFS
ncbi:Hypothetical predicted protein [Mytilus galloprovincialis]|uniref:Exonuclease domain-containing protein n=1 Tax=Mytilus galloprovincialis TaxID=29158 RepID=A0A8B6D5F5_MYTGA|nr:Hypothetical predicted protein [Mytilus galloprovincialis]